MSDQPSGWLERLLNSPYATWWFALLFMLEAVLFAPLDLVIGLFAFKKPRELHFYSALGAIGSMIGAGIGYLIGALAWDTIGHRLVSTAISPEHFSLLTSWYSRLHGPVIFITGLLPLPFKLFTISAGFCSLPILSFLFFILLSRYTRYTLVALATRRWGHHLTKLPFNNLAHTGLRVGLLLACALVLC
jgi:membrane protein YqaA with SNARE-associated domain